MSQNNVCLDTSCRLCADICDGDIDHIFSNDNMYLVDLIEKYLSIIIVMDDTLPVQVCELCRLKVISFNEYALKCSTTQITLASISQGAKINMVDMLLESVKTECNTDIKHEIVDDYSIKSENDDNYSDEPYTAPKSSKRRSKKKNFKTKDKKIKSKKYSLRGKNKAVKPVSPDLNISLSEIKIEPDEIIDIPTKEKRVSAINRSFINFVCHMCNEEFFQWFALEKHTKQIHKVKPKILCLCDKYLTCKQTVYKHIKKHDTNIIHSCTICDKSFFEEKNLEKHHLAVHTNNTVTEYKCQQCGQAFDKKFLLNAHEKKHIPKEVRYINSCEICGGMFASKHAVQVHIKAVHYKEKPHVCDICGRAFTSKGTLKAHRFFHSGERPFTCPHCPLTYKTSKALKRHTDVHDGVTYKCTKCPSQFSYEKTLREHMHLHIDTCRFVCGFCNKGFKWRRSFESHLNNHTGKTPFACPWCPKTFADGSNCRIHKRRKHAVELAEYEAKNGINNIKRIKRISTNEEKIPRSIQFVDTIQPQVFPKIDNINTAKSGTDSE